jgi:hypothetical protein
VAGVKGGVVTVVDVTGGRSAVTTPSGVPRRVVAAASFGARPLGTDGELHSVETDLTKLCCPAVVRKRPDGGADFDVVIGTVSSAPGIVLCVLGRYQV